MFLVKCVEYWGSAKRGQHQSDGMVERYNRTLEHQLAIFVNENQRDWDQHIPLLLMAYRTTVQESTGCTPAKLIMDHELGMPIDLLYGYPEDYYYEYARNLREFRYRVHKFGRERLELTARKMKRRYDIDTSAERLEPGSSVWLYNPRIKKEIFT